MKIEVVRRFVKKGDVGLGQQQAGQGNSHLPPPAELVARAVPGAWSETQAVKDRAYNFLFVEAASQGQTLGRIGQCGRGIVVTAFDAGLGSLDFGSHGIEVVSILLNLFPDRQRGARYAVLWQPAHADLTSAMDLARVGRGLPEDGSEQGSFARTIAADEAHLRRRDEVKCRVVDDAMSGDAERRLFKTDHGGLPGRT